MPSTLYYAEATPVQGYTSLMLMLAVANLTAADLSSEIEAVSSLNVSMFIRDYNPEVTNNTGNAPTRLGSTVQLPVEGNTQFSPIEARYVYDPQAATSTADNKARAFLTRGTEFYALVRKGLDVSSVAYAAGQYYELTKYRAGRQNFGRSGEDEFAEYEIVQQWFPLIEPVEGLIVA